jgi:hypothetical protein
VGFLLMIGPGSNTCMCSRCSEYDSTYEKEKNEVKSSNKEIKLMANFTYWKKAISNC